MNNPSTVHRLRLMRNSVVVLVLVLAVSTNQWIQRCESLMIAQLLPVDVQLAKQERVNGEMENRYLSHPSFSNFRHKKRQQHLFRNLTALQSVHRGQWPPLVWDAPFPLVLLTSQEDTVQMYIGDVDAELEIRIRPTENPSTEPQTDLYRARFPLPKNSWQFFDVQIADNPPSLIRFGLSTQCEINLNQELELQLARPTLFSPENEVRGIQHILDFEDGNIGPLIGKKIIRGFKQGIETSYLMQLELRSTKHRRPAE